MVIKNYKNFILGLFIFLIPFLGLPLSFKFFLVGFCGLLLSFFSFSFSKINDSEVKEGQDFFDLSSFSNPVKKVRKPRVKKVVSEINTEDPSEEVSKEENNL